MLFTVVQFEVNFSYSQDGLAHSKPPQGSLVHNDNCWIDWGGGWGAAGEMEVGKGRLGFGGR